MQSVSAFKSAPCATGLFVLPRAPLVRLARRRCHSGCLLSHAHRRVCRSTVVIHVFRRLLAVSRRAPLADSLSLPFSLSLATMRACPPTDRPNDTTMASLLAPSQVSFSFPTCFTHLTHASNISAFSHPQLGVSTVSSSSAAFLSFQIPCYY